jgi:hypothetical protein
MTTVLNISSPFRSAQNINIRLIRRDSDDAGNDDDLISLVYKGEDTYHVYYKDSKVSNAYRTVLSGEEVDNYFESLFTLLVNDRESFESVQFDLPCCPSVIYKMKDMNNDILFNALSSLMPILHSAERVSFQQDTSQVELETNVPSYESYWG